MKPPYLLPAGWMLGPFQLTGATGPLDTGEEGAGKDGDEEYISVQYEVFMGKNQHSWRQHNYEGDGSVFFNRNLAEAGK